MDETTCHVGMEIVVKSLSECSILNDHYNPAHWSQNLFGRSAVIVNVLQGRSAMGALPYALIRYPDGEESAMFYDWMYPMVLKPSDLVNWIKKERHV